MADGPTIVNSGGGGTVVAVILGIIAIVVLLFFTGVININGSGGKDVNVSVNTPKVEAPSAPSITVKPAAPAKPAPAPNGG
ncbi:hypothetical protein RFM98_00420 [Mesorhizobium sp. VK9D]|uniref:hypothetical protein n=1 Tax=Mesorhizobium australafricanum TaxID=3072311 RepID=UPI002A2476A9|nr:hypothetical protein [Mesorhizobium sp. VK9D]MDX8451211.1 hypothetical protein [Mesorhizobium sp. VK9D]